MHDELPNTDADAERRRRHTAGALDIRNVIGSLLGIYGVVLTVTGLVSDDAGEQTGDLDANLWAGLALIVISVGFLAWVRLRPIVVEEEPAASDAAAPRPDATE